jgi:hypothetical protein
MTSPKQKKRRNRLLAFQDTSWQNRRHNTVPGEVPPPPPPVVTVERCRFANYNRKRRLMGCDGRDDTVNRLLGSTTCTVVLEQAPVPVVLPVVTEVIVPETVTTEDDDMETECDTNMNCDSNTPVFNTDATNVNTSAIETDETTKDKVNEKDKSYVILPWDGITTFLADNFKCRECGSSIEKHSIQKVQVGLATLINFFCANKKCRHNKEEFFG